MASRKEPCHTMSVYILRLGPRGATHNIILVCCTALGAAVLPCHMHFRHFINTASYTTFCLAVLTIDVIYITMESGKKGNDASSLFPCYVYRIKNIRICFMDWPFMLSMLQRNNIVLHNYDHVCMGSFATGTVTVNVAFVTQ